MPLSEHSVESEFPSIDNVYGVLDTVAGVETVTVMGFAPHCLFGRATVQVKITGETAVHDTYKLVTTSGKSYTRDGIELIADLIAVETSDADAVPPTTTEESEMVGSVRELMLGSTRTCFTSRGCSRTAIVVVLSIPVSWNV
jgi:hypothetical protein